MSLLALFMQLSPPEDLATLAVEAAAAAWLTKAVVDLVRQRTTIEGAMTLLLAAVLAVVFTVAWSFYAGNFEASLAGYAALVLRSVLAFLGAIAVTETQKVAARVRARRA